MMKNDREFYEAIRQKVQRKKEAARLTRARLYFHSSLLSLLLCCLCFLAMTPATRRGSEIDSAPSLSTSPTDNVLDDFKPPVMEGDPPTSNPILPSETTPPPPGNAPPTSAPTQPESVITTVPTVSDPDRNDDALPPSHYGPNEASTPSDPRSFSSFLPPLAFGFLFLSFLFFILARHKRRA